MQLHEATKLSRLQQQLDALNRSIDAKLAEMRAELDAVNAKIAALDPDEGQTYVDMVAMPYMKRGPGRPRKNV
jgi:prefoldin subunit 5